MKRPIFFIFSCIGIFSLAAHAHGQDANEIVRKADSIRAPEGSYVFEATVESFDDEKKTGENGYFVSVKDLDHTLVEFRFPATELGKSMLMLKDDIWVFLPRLSKPVRVPLKNRLLGEVAIGDMTRTNFSHDYQATLTGEETLQGQAAYVLDLKARSPDKPYGHIKFWVAKENFRPIQAEYFTISGKSLKTVLFGGFTQAAGAFRPLQGTFIDSVRKDKKTVLTFKNMAAKELPDQLFSKHYMQTR